MPANNCNYIDQKWWCCLKNDDPACFAWTMMMLIALLEKWWCWLLCLKMMMLIALLEKWWCWLLCLKNDDVDCFAWKWWCWLLCLNKTKMVCLLKFSCLKKKKKKKKKKAGKHKWFIYDNVTCFLQKYIAGPW